jgi:hypothetical protein
MTDKAHMREAAPHIEKALNSLEMLRLFIENKDKLSLAKRVPQYYQTLVDNVLALQKILLTDSEYIERVNRGLEEVSSDRVISINFTENNDGDTFCVLDATLPVKKMKGLALFGGKVPSHVN